jgi:hypothetical protein
VLSFRAMSKKVDSKTESKTGEMHGDEEYENVGQRNWANIRNQWLQSKSDKGHKVKSEVKAKNVDVDDLIDRIYSQSGNGALKDPLPLGQMIDLLIDFWESDGLYD